MFIGCDDFWELGEVRIAVALGQIAENLVVGTVLFDDVDYMFDVLAQLSQQGRSRGDSVRLKPLFSATCPVSSSSWDGLGTGRVNNPALANCNV